MILPAIREKRLNPLLSPSIVLALYDHRGLRGSCGPECYNGSSPLCACICDGRHHGVGFSTAKNMAEAHVCNLAEDSTQYVIILNGTMTVTVNGLTWYAISEL